MTNTPDVKSCVCAESGDPIQAPFCSLHYHFGMLLGVGDFKTDQAYHRGKIWMHSSWLHRAGVVWGFGVQADAAEGEVRVRPGLAIDALGREIHLEADACLNVGAWFDDRRQKAPDDTSWFAGDPAAGPITFDAHVVIRFKACLTRQVPALAEPCENAGSSTAYSRSCETVEILFRPGLWPDPFAPAGGEPAKPRPYHRLRLLFGLDPPLRDEHGQILDDDLAVLTAPRTSESFRRFAARDEIELAPPEGEEFPVLLANVHGVKLTKDGDGWDLSIDSVDVEARPSHVATAAMQDLVGGPISSRPGAVVLSDSVTVDETANQITLAASADLAPKSIQSSAFALTSFDPNTGWADVPLDPPALDADNRTLTLSFPGGIPNDAKLARLVVRCSGSAPILDASFSPFNHGQDFIYDHRRS